MGPGYGGRARQCPPSQSSQLLRALEEVLSNSGGGGGHCCPLSPRSGDNSSLSSLSQAEKHRSDLHWGHTGRGGGPRTVSTQSKEQGSLAQPSPR